MARLVNHCGMSFDEAWSCSIVEYVALTSEAVKTGKAGKPPPPLPNVRDLENEFRLKGFI